jgi:hypothetical protein
MESQLAYAYDQYGPYQYELCLIIIISVLPVYKCVWSYRGNVENVIVVAVRVSERLLSELDFNSASTL